MRYIDVGGGLGVPEKAGQAGPRSRARSTRRSTEIKRGCGGRSLFLEPGRFIVAQAGVLLARVTQTKGKGDVQYVGVGTGMNSLIRPALYGAYHDIVNLTRLGKPATELVTVVGPICETGDRLGSDRLLPPAKENDVLLIANAGAYGYGDELALQPARARERSPDLTGAPILRLSRSNVRRASSASVKPRPASRVTSGCTASMSFARLAASNTPAKSITSSPAAVACARPSASSINDERPLMLGSECNRAGFTGVDLVEPPRR